MKKKFVSLAALAALGISSALGINYVNNVNKFEFPQEGQGIRIYFNFYEKKEQTGIREFRYYFENGIIVDTVYEKDGSFRLDFAGVKPLDDFRLYYDNKKDVFTYSKIWNTPQVKIIDEKDDGSIETIILEPCKTEKILSKEEHKEIYQKATEMINELKEIMHYKDIKEEALKFKFPEGYTKSLNTLEDFLEKCREALKK